MLDEWGGEGAHSGLPTAARLVSCIWKEAVPGIASLEGPGNLQLRTGFDERTQWAQCMHDAGTGGHGLKQQGAHKDTIFTGVPAEGSPSEMAEKEIVSVNILFELSQS